MFRDEERGIFRYWNGESNADGSRRIVCADPMVISRRMVTAETPDGKTYNDIWERLNAGTPDVPLPYRLAAELVEQQLIMLRDVFGVRALDSDGNGLTEEETHRILDEFNAFMTDLKKSGGPSPGSSASTAGPLADSDSEPARILPAAPPMETPVEPARRGL